MKLLFAFLLLAAPVVADDLDKELTELQNQAKRVEETVRGAMEKVQGLDREKAERVQKKVSEFASDPNVLRSFQEIWAHPHRNQVFLFQGIFLLVMILVKAWRQSKAKNWLWKLWVGFFYSVLTWTGVIYVIPLAVFGSPFRTLTSALARLFF